ncbi:hypothetical protein P1J78_17560 [Psychromarinibacter sp. C21-152]|uniref:Helix-turn-helix n=1 Tax=Psychromarinibacter sediminicola TaxID=3033385 RepID=A0AAE3NVQ2_9RHOB|nr:helix-turn-helix domain-containing protein [Psychromarinibacter sediminicola]MDF0602549.1 hypothetical protein [Psychromarinibacter sediminicola]
MTPFAEKFRSLAASSDKSYRDIAGEMGQSPALIARVLNGSRPPSEAFVSRTIKVFGLRGGEIENLRHLAEISQEKIVVVPKDWKEAERIVAFVRELRSEKEKDEVIEGDLK